MNKPTTTEKLKKLLKEKWYIFVIIFLIIPFSSNGSQNTKLEKELETANSKVEDAAKISEDYENLKKEYSELEKNLEKANEELALKNSELESTKKELASALTANETKATEVVNQPEQKQVDNNFEQGTPATTGNYIANANTGKYHIGDCRYIKSMNEGNKVTFNSSSDASNSGYVPCKVCRP